MTVRLRVILQSEASECAVACLAMVANFHGRRVSLSDVRKMTSVSLKGVTLDKVMAHAELLGLTSRAVRVDLDEISHLALPAILHWRMNHFVVLEQVSNEGITVLDPGVGRRRVSRREFSEEFTGVALEISPVAQFKELHRAPAVRLRDLWTHIDGFWQTLTQLIGLSLTLQALILVSPFYLQITIDQAIVERDQSFLTALALVFATIVIVTACIQYLRGHILLRIGYQLSSQLITNIFSHLLRLPIAFFETRHIGDIVSRMSSTEPIRRALTQGLVGAIIDLMMLLVTAIIIILYDIQLAVVVFGFALIAALINLYAFYIIKPAERDAIYRAADEETFRLETIRAASAVKLHTSEMGRLGTWQNLFGEFITSSFRRDTIYLSRTTLIQIFASLQLVTVVYVGATKILGDTGFTVGMLVAFLFYREIFVGSVSRLFDLYIQFRLLSLHLDRIGDIIKQPPEVAGGILDIHSEQGKNFIEVRELGFRYSESDDYIFESMNISIKKGELVVITGPSGGGKSTLLKVLIGLYPASKGTIEIAGTTLRPGNIRSWRSKIGVVMQDDDLLSGSIAENISFFATNFDQHNVEVAAKKAGIHDEIMQMPMGYHSTIGDMGSVLSGGQKQRVLLARALYRKPTVLFLDEGTSNLDIEREKQIVDVICNLNITRIVIAHRPEFLERASRRIIIS